MTSAVGMQNIGPWHRCDLPAEIASAAVARRMVADHTASLPADVAGDACLLVSEIVTNAVQHGEPAISLAVRVDPEGVGVAVTDHGIDLPDGPTSAPAATATSGRGLLILGALARDWGVTSTVAEPGKTVWFELRTR